MISPQPKVEILPPAGGAVKAVVIVLHGGQVHSRRSAGRIRLAYVRMLPFATALHRAGSSHGIAVWRLRYRYRGWNGVDEDPVRDAEWALREVAKRHPATPVVLVGHSMGARAALRVAGDSAVVAVCALAPWLEKGDPVAQLAGREILIAHGDRERMTDPAESLRYALRARGVTEKVCRFEVHGDGHAMLRRARDWTNLVCDFTLSALHAAPETPLIAAAFGDPSETGLTMPLPVGERAATHQRRDPPSTEFTM